jgi:hypothetical protein
MVDAVPSAQTEEPEGYERYEGCGTADNAADDGAGLALLYRVGTMHW